MPAAAQRNTIPLMDANRTFRSIRKAAHSVVETLRVFVIMFAIAFSPLGLSINACQCFGCECSQTDDGACPCSHPEIDSCCSSGNCSSSGCCDPSSFRTTASILVDSTQDLDAGKECGCDCHDCHCNVGIAVDPIALPGINDASKPILDFEPEVLETLPTPQLSQLHHELPSAVVVQQFRVIHCCWLI